MTGISIMTPRERILSTYRHEIPDRVPVSIYAGYLRTGSVEREARNRGLGVLVIYPLVSFLAPPWHTRPGYISEVRNADLRIRYTWKGGTRIEYRAYETPVGTVSQRIVKEPGYGSDWIQEHYIKRREDYRIVQYIVENTVFQSQEKAVRQKIDDLGTDGVLMGRIDRSPYQKLLIELAGPERFLLDLYTDPEPAIELMETMNQRVDEQFTLALESRAEIVFQPENLTSDLTPPDRYREFHIPIFQKRGQACSEAQKIYIVHLDGKLRSLLSLIADSPFDVIDSFSLPEMAGDVTVSEALAVWPRKVLCPNFPTVLCNKPEEEIRKYLDALWMDFSGNKPFMLQLSEDFPLDSYHRILPLLCEFSKGHLYR
jgi:uroporphyrinogen-III decarboxylase